MTSNSSINRWRNAIEATCKLTHGWEIGDEVASSIRRSNYEGSLTVGKSYKIFGMRLEQYVDESKTALEVLIADDADKPGRYPIGLFNVPSQPLPREWRMDVKDAVAASGGLASRPGGLVIAFGYEKLLQDEDHWLALVERDPTALQVFNNELVRPPLEEWENDL